jgi:hypothetical protein
MEQLHGEELLKLAITESARLLPYVITSRKAIKLYLKVASTSLSGALSKFISAGPFERMVHWRGFSSHQCDRCRSEVVHGNR